MKKINKKAGIIRVFVLVLLIISALTFVSCELLSGDTDVTKTKLTAPYGLRLEDGYLCWNPVEHATRYIVSVDGNEYYCSDYKYSLSAVEDGEHVFRVKAAADGVLFDSSDFSIEYKANLFEGQSASSGYYSQFDDLTKNESFLGYGFDVINSSVFSDKYVKTSFPLFKTDELMNLRLLKVDSKYVSIDETQSSSIEEFMESWNANANVNVSWGKKKVGGSVKVKAAYSGGVENAASKYFHCVSFNNQKFYIVMQGDMATYRNIISDSLKADLYSDMEPSALFDRYGTHFITSAVMGGRINSYYLYTSTEEKSYHDISAKVSTEVRYFAGKTDVSVSGGYKNEASSQNIDIRNTLEVIGGGDFGMTSDADLKENYAAWEKSLDDHASLMGIKDTGSLQPIWQLIDPTLDTKTYTWDYDGDGNYESGTRAEQLQAYFFAYGVESYNELLESAGLPELIAPTEITNVLVNGTKANNNGEYEVFAGIENDITFSVDPEEAVGYTKVIALSGASDYASINEKNQLVVSPNAPHNTTLTVVLSAGNVRKQIKVRILKSYTVDFETNCDTIIPSLVGVRHGKQIVEPVLEEREGYEFVGWYTTYDFYEGTEYKFGEQAIIGDLTLYARWQKFYPTITFKHNYDDIEETSQQVAYNKAFEKPDTPKHQGYDFVGWYIDDRYVEEFDFTQVIKKNTKIYLKWTPKSFTVSFNSNGGNGKIESQVVKYNEKATAPNQPIKDDYEFIGWYKEADCINLFDFNNETITDNITLYAKWGKGTIEIVFDTNCELTIDPRRIESGSSLGVNLPSPTREGYNFDGWYTLENFDSSSRVYSNTTFTNNTTVYAKWKTKVYTVTVQGISVDTPSQIDSNGNPKYSSKEFGTLYYAYGDDVYNQGFYLDETLANKLSLNYFDKYCVDTQGNSNFTFGGLVSAAIENNGHSYANSSGKVVLSNDNELLATPVLDESTKAGVVYALLNPKQYTITLNTNASSQVALVLTNSNYSTSTKAYYNEKPTNIATMPQGNYYVPSAYATQDGTTYFYNTGTSSRYYNISGDSTMYCNWGQKYEGVYIHKENGLAAIGQTGTYYIIEDITLSGDWTPISTFSGIIDGLGHTISGLIIVQNSVGNFGLIAVNSGTIKNLTLSGCNITNNDTNDYGIANAGLICGYNKSSGIIDNITITNGSNIAVDVGSLNSDHDNEVRVGFVCGLNEGGTISNCNVSNNTLNAYCGSKHGRAYCFTGGVCGKTTGGIFENISSTNNKISPNAKADHNTYIFGIHDDFGYPYLYNGGIVAYSSGATYKNIQGNNNDQSGSFIDNNCDKCGNYGYAVNQLVAYSSGDKYEN